MTSKGLAHVAIKLLPELQALMSARRQARWQWKQGADQHRVKWQVILAMQDSRIAELERQIAGQSGVAGFRAKREIVK